MADCSFYAEEEVIALTRLFAWRMKEKGERGEREVREKREKG